MLRRKFLQLLGLAPLAAVPAAKALATPRVTRVTTLWDESAKALSVFVDGKHVRRLTLEEIVLDWEAPEPELPRPKKPCPSGWSTTTTTAPSPRHHLTYVYDIPTNSWQFSHRE